MSSVTTDYVKPIEIVCEKCGNVLATLTLKDSDGPNWRFVICLDCQNNVDGVPLNLKDYGTGNVVTKNVALAKTVRALLSFDARHLIPRIVAATDLDDYAVTLELPDRAQVLSHAETLESQGVRANDTVVITKPTKS